MVFRGIKSRIRLSRATGLRDKCGDVLLLFKEGRAGLLIWGVCQGMDGQWFRVAI